MDPDQAQCFDGPDLNPICLALIVFLKEFFEKIDFEKKSADAKKKNEQFPSGQRVKLTRVRVDLLRGGSWISGHGVHMYKGVGVRFAYFISNFIKYPMKMK